MDEQAEPEAEGTNFFQILSEECLTNIINECSALSVGRLSVCCQDFNTLLKDRVPQAKTIFMIELTTYEPFDSESVNLLELNLGCGEDYDYIVSDITDITPLSALVNLQKLYANDNQISDITPLSALVNLQILVLDNNQISDITPLSALVRLTFIGLKRNQISDITPLSVLFNHMIEEEPDFRVQYKLPPRP
eukprot:SAG11_NODE_12962_length_676_cov_34.464471_1_plen_191_part_01